MQGGGAYEWVHLLLLMLTMSNNVSAAVSNSVSVSESVANMSKLLKPNLIVI